MSDEEKLKATIWKARQKLDAIETRKAKTELKKYVGKFFKYQNYYSVPQNKSDYWFLYTSVLKLKGRYLEVVRFQTDKYGEISISKKSEYGIGTLGDEITKKEYLDAFKSLSAKIATFKQPGV